MADNRTQIILHPEAQAARRWAALRRLSLLTGLVIGLVLFFLWLPDGARAALFAALRANRTFVGMLLLFSLIAVSLVWSAGQRLDRWIFQLLNIRGRHPQWLDRVMWLATQLGGILAVAIFAGLSVAFHYRRLAVEAILGTLTLWLLVEIIKALTDRARPFLDLETARVVGWRERGRSFPSGHTAQVFFLMTLLIHWFRLGAVGIVAVSLVAVLVGFTRLYVGAHYPRDVIGGAMLGSAWGIVATVIDPYWFGRF